MPVRIAALLLTPLLILAGPALAQTQRWRLQRGSGYGPGSQIEPHCVKLRDGSIECRPRPRRRRGDTPARPYFEPFSN
ncbi:MAG: hypothetical protein VKI81_02030 [Synechococcaceae cyanobacterium]|nr:hypothetical protein [Synechococcaceae cyanobacterium]